MRFHRVISVLTLATFIPLAVGCSTQRTVRLDSDPGDTSSAVASDEPTKINGYTTADSGFHEWNGQMSAVGVDSLEFTRVRPGTVSGTNRPPDGAADKRQETMRLAKAEVVSVDVVDTHPGRTVGLVLGLVVLSWAALIGSAAAQGDFME